MLGKYCLLCMLLLVEGAFPAQVKAVLFSTTLWIYLFGNLSHRGERTPTNRVDGANQSQGEGIDQILFANNLNRGHDFFVKLHFVSLIYRGMDSSLLSFTLPRCS